MGTQHANQEIAPPTLIPPNLAGIKDGAAETYFPPKTWAIASFRNDAEPFGFHPADLAELADAHRLSEEIMDMRLAPIWALASAHLHTGATAWIHRETHESGAMNGVFLVLPL